MHPNERSVLQGAPIAPCSLSIVAAEIRALEELALNAWPARQTVYDDGWVLRLSDGHTRRANSINPLYPSRVPFADKLDRCEHVYASRGQATVFKLTAASPPDLDAFLAQRGYEREAPTLVQTLDFVPRSAAWPAPRQNASPVTLHVSDWLGVYSQLTGTARSTAALIGAALEAIVPDTCYLALRREGDWLAAGRAVLERGHVGLFDLVTAPHARNQGFGRHLVMALLGWGQERGARRAYLQVMEENAVALHLYAMLGFKDSYPYWYRVRVVP